MSETVWLARWSMRRAWWSYPLTTFLVAIPGAFILALLPDVSSADEQAAWVAADIFLLAGCTTLGWNYGSSAGWQMMSSQTLARLSFYRSLPIGTPQLVAGRALALLPALAGNVAGLFVTPYVISAALGTALSQQVSVVAYVWFVLMWIGYALVYAGVHIYGEFAVRAGMYNLVFTITVVPPLVAIAVAHLVFGTAIVPALFELAGTHGPIGAGVALLAGLAVLPVWLRATARRAARRDVLP